MSDADAVGNVALHWAASSRAPAVLELHGARPGPSPPCRRPCFGFQAMGWVGAALEGGRVPGALLDIKTVLDPRASAHNFAQHPFDWWWGPDSPHWQRGSDTDSCLLHNHN